MATYKVWLTVKDRYGSKKELSGGTVTVGLDTINEDEVKALDAHFATDAALADAINKSPDTIRYAGFELEDKTEE